MSSLFGLLLSLLGFGLLIFLHELGHFLVARWYGIQVDVFSIGFGKPIWSTMWRGVRWQVGWFPFGGYVLMRSMGVESDDPVESDPGPDVAAWKKMLVAFAGPFANWLVAIVLFSLIFVLGGRVLPFAEVSPYIGAIEQSSPLAGRGLQNGDEIVSLDGRPYRHRGEMIFASLAGGQLTVEARSALGRTEPGDPFTVSIQQVPVSDIIRPLWFPARFLVVGEAASSNPFLEGAPILQSGIQVGDRLIWMDGAMLWSPRQILDLLSDELTLLTIERGGVPMLARVPRKRLEQVAFSPSGKNEWVDWFFAAGLKQKQGSIWILPVELNAQLVVQKSQVYPPADEPQQSDYAFLASQYLQAGDRITAVGGHPVTSGPEFLKELQVKRVHLLVSRQALPDVMTDAVAKDLMQTTASASWLRLLVQEFIQGKQLISAGSVFMLQPFTPKPITQFDMSPQTREELELGFEQDRQQALSLTNASEREMLLARLQAVRDNNNPGFQNGALKDLRVQYNPGPWIQMTSAFNDSILSIKKLALGQINTQYISGPVGMVSAMQRSWTDSVAGALHLLAMVSLTLAVFNLLPLPILDGGRILILCWEWATGRRLSASAVKWIYLPCVVMIVGLLLYVTIFDVMRLFGR
ncbi:MAG: site-2 protease family protein [Chlamydiia bacterium]